MRLAEVTACFGAFSLVDPSWREMADTVPLGRMKRRFSPQGKRLSFICAASGGEVAIVSGGGKVTVVRCGGFADA